jgi:hypothetical protein
MATRLNLDFSVFQLLAITRKPIRRITDASPETAQDE